MHVITWPLSGWLTIASLLLTGCATSRHPAGIASSSAPIPQHYTQIGVTERESCGYSIFFIPLGGMDSPDDMIAEMTKEKGAHALVGVTVEHTRSFFALPLVGSECTAIKGIAVRGVQ
jgi:hypothetical protein